MERVKVLLPDNFNFYAYLKIRITDLNYGGHVGNDVFLSLVHDARLQFLDNYGYSELNFAGAGLIMVDAAIEYKLELVHGNEIRIGVTAQGFNKLGFDLYYIIEVKSGEQWLVAGKVKTGMLCFDYETKKKVSIPEGAIEKLQSSFM